MKPYRSPYEAYPFLSDPGEDQRCDFEIMTDRIASAAGLLASLCPERREELLRIDELVYHANPTLRTFLSVTEDEVTWLKELVDTLAKETAGLCHVFVLPAGTPRACAAHLLRTETKQLVRLIYRHMEQSSEVPPLLIDFANLLSGYFFHLALWLNHQDGFEEIPFVSRNYR